MAQVVVEMIGDEAKLYRAFVKIMQGQDQVDQGFKRMKHSAHDMQGKVSESINTITHMATAWLSVEKAIEMATETQERYQQILRKAADTHKQMADAQRQALLNVGDPAKNAQVIAEVGKISAELKPFGGDKAVYQVFAQAISGARGDTARALQATREAVRLSPTNAEAAGAFAYSLPQTAERLGPGTTMKQAAGFQIAMQKQSLTPSPGMVAEHLVPAWRAMVAMGSDPLKAAAWVTATQAATGDKEGAKTATLIGQMMKEAHEVLNKRRDGKDKPHDQWITEPLAQFEAIRADPKLRDKFLAGELGRGAMRFLVASMFGRGDDRGWKIFQENQRSFTPREQWESQAEQFMRGMEQQKTQKASELHRGGEVAVEELYKTPQGERLARKAALSSEETNKLLEAAGETSMEWIGNRAERFFKWFNPFSDSERVRLGQLEARKNTLLYGSDKPYVTNILGGGEEVQLPKTTDPERLERAHILEKRIAELTEALEANTKATENSDPSSAHSTPNTKPAL